MKLFKKLICFMLMGVLSIGMISALAGCSNDKKLVVNTMFGTGDTHERTFLRYNAKFIDEHEGIKIENRSGIAESQDWKSGFSADMGSKNNVPDVVFYFSGTPMDEWRDQLVTVEEIRKEYPDFCKDITINDNDAASIEMKLGVQGLMYNDDVYDAADFASYDTMMTKLKENSTDSAKRAAVSGDLPHYWYNHLMARFLGTAEFQAMNGTKAYFTDAKKALWIDASLKAVEEMRAIGFVGKGATNAAEANAFYGGTRGIAIDGQWVSGNIDAAQKTEEMKDKIKLTHFPKDKDNKDFVIGGVTNGWYITKKAWDNKAKRKLAVEYVQLHSTADAINSYCVDGGGFAANGKEVVGAGYGSKAFKSLIDNHELLVAIDDRVSALAKQALYGDWSVSKALPALLEKADAVTKAEVTTVFEDFISKLN